MNFDSPPPCGQIYFHLLLGTIALAAFAIALWWNDRP